jgi:xanthine dehydrogenase YagT iron-sulfur-binding subunit
MLCAVVRAGLPSEVGRSDKRQTWHTGVPKDQLQQRIGTLMDENAAVGPALTRRVVLETGTASATLLLTGFQGTAQATVELTSEPDPVIVHLLANGYSHELRVDPRTTLLDALREHLALTGPKKGCDHGQCGACTVLLEGRRINACLTLAVMHDGESVTTVEGLADGDTLHPLQASFIEYDGFQCGYCTSGQLCSAAGMLMESRAGMPSFVTMALSDPAPSLTDDEIRERMSGNICRCAAYPNIVAAIKRAAGILA